MLIIKPISGLEKVTLDKGCQQAVGGWCGEKNIVMLKGERYGFQIAYKIEGVKKQEIYSIKLSGDIAKYCTVRNVSLVPCSLPCYPDRCDDNYIAYQPALLPDLLEPLIRDSVVANDKWRTVYVLIETHYETLEGKYDLNIEFIGENEKSSVDISVEILRDKLPRQTLLYTQWFHLDSLADYYDVDVFSPRHWDLIDKYLDTAVKMGINIILTPVFTPPLDTQIGGSRLEVQLVDIKKNGESWLFNMEKLDKYIKLCVSKGIDKFELPHLFTQWGARHAPNIYADVDNSHQLIFGWETSADDTEYAEFLNKLLPAVYECFSHNGISKDKLFLHISDEPSINDLPYYKSAKSQVKHLLSGVNCIDAISDYEFYKSGLITTPVVATNHISEFIENDAYGIWAYTCCGQSQLVSNRFIAMPSWRNRILGIQLYLYDITGFLHWGYNFYYTQNALQPVDPFRVTDAGGAFPSGDAFSVYPGKNAPLESLHGEVFYQGLQDMRALQLLESKIGRQAVKEMLLLGTQGITFERYPHGAQWQKQLRQRVYDMIKNN